MLFLKYSVQTSIKYWIYFCYIIQLCNKFLRVSLFGNNTQPSHSFTTQIAFDWIWFFFKVLSGCVSFDCCDKPPISMLPFFNLIFLLTTYQYLTMYSYPPRSTLSTSCLLPKNPPSLISVTHILTGAWQTSSGQLLTENWVLPTLYQKPSSVESCTSASSLQHLHHSFKGSLQ